MKSIGIMIIMLLIALAAFSQVAFGQSHPWSWIKPLKTTKSEIEKAFGKSITKDETNPYQTYVAKFGKLNISFSSAGEYIRECVCRVAAGRVVTVFVAPKNLLLSSLNIELNKFRKDVSAAPREISYSCDARGILIATTIVKRADGTQTEQVTAIEYRPTAELFYK